MKVDFCPKFHKGEIHSIYYERLLKKAARVGADEDLVRKLETLVYFDRTEALVRARVLDVDLSVLPEMLRAAAAPDAEKVFLALCYAAEAMFDWALYFENAEETATLLADELELYE